MNDQKQSQARGIESPLRRQCVERREGPKSLSSPRPGWAQIKGLRGDTDLVERIKSDLFYLENWSLLLDFQIMAMTFCRTTNAC